MQSIALDKQRHHRKGFDCGVDALNNYLKLMANQQSKKDNSRTYVLEDGEKNGTITGFYSLSMINIELDTISAKAQKRHPRSQIAGLIARLAVDRRYTGRGLGAWLLIDALKRLLSASETVGFPMVIVDAKEGAVSFYEQFGFKTFQEEEHRLFITIADIRASFKDQ